MFKCNPLWVPGSNTIISRIMLQNIKKIDNVGEFYYVV